MSTNKVDEQKTMEPVCSQREDGPADSHDRLGDRVFRTKQPPKLLTDSASSKLPTNCGLTNKQRSDKKAFEKELVDDVLVRYWDSKEKQHVASGNSRGRDCFSLSQTDDYKSPVPPNFGITRKCDDSSHSPPGNDFKSAARSRFTQKEPTSRTNSKDQLSRFIPAEDIKEEKYKMMEKDHPGAAITPVDPDVLFGRRQAQRKHPGNIRLRELCHGQQDGDYLAHCAYDPTRRGRFLKFDSEREDWTEVDNDMAREKVAFTIRDTFHQVPAQEP